MLTNRAAPDGDERTFLVKCESCSFERTADGRDTATEIGTDHQRSTSHDVLAFEVPSSITQS